MNKKPPEISFRRKDKGGINLTCMCEQTKGLDTESVTTILSVSFCFASPLAPVPVLWSLLIPTPTPTSFPPTEEYRIPSADVTLRSDCSPDDLIDVIEGNRVYIPCIYVLNKIDAISIEELDIIYKIPHAVPISAHHKWNFDDLLEKMWEYLNLTRMFVLGCSRRTCRPIPQSPQPPSLPPLFLPVVRSYTKPRGQLPDYEAPVVLRGSKTSVEDFCNTLHKQMMNDFK